MAEKKIPEQGTEKSIEKRGRGRPKGTGGNKRPDKREAMSVHAEPGDNRKYLLHSVKLAKWPKVDMKDPKQVEQRVMDYFTACAEDDMKPSVAGAALAFGIDRATLWKWCNGVESAYIPAESRSFIKKAYLMLNVQMEDYMQNGKINPVAGIFLMKNNLGYADKQEVVLTPNQQGQDEVSPEELKRKYLSDVAGVITEDED